MIESLWTEVITNGAFYWHLLVEHIEITMIAVVFSVIVGMGIGIAIADRPKIARVVISIVNALCTIPAIALLGVLISITGIGNTTAIIALILYALLPIVRGTTVGIMSIDPKVIEAAVAMGSRPCQTLLKIKLPLAMPILFASLRNMVTMTIALAGIASFVGAGGAWGRDLSWDYHQQ